MSTEIIIGDCLAALKSMRAGSVHCVVTSPPYFGLRDYGTATWEGGSPDCDHKTRVQPRTERPQGKLNSLGYVDEAQVISRGDCPRCGAKRTDEQIGLEESPELYVERLVDVGREIHRVLRDDGTFWLNLGDSYARTGGTDRQGSRSAKAGNTRRTMEAISDRTQRAPQGLKDKDLIGIPWMVAFALRADGWYLRRDIIWSKPNPMPESITDRCTSSRTGRQPVSRCSGESPPDFRGDSLSASSRSTTGGTALCTVLDPFGGAGTTAIVAESLGRNAIIIELNAEYAKLAQGRIHNEPLVFEHLR